MDDGRDRSRDGDVGVSVGDTSGPQGGAPLEATMGQANDGELERLSLSSVSSTLRSFLLFLAILRWAPARSRKQGTPTHVLGTASIN